MIGSVSVLSVATVVLVASHLSSKDVPVISPLSRGVVDIVHNAAAVA
jgi:hypothetical protein